MSNVVYILLLTTESGDDYEWVFNRKPTEDEVYKIFQRDIPDEVTPDDEDDPWGTAQFWRIVTIDVEYL